ncbi:hypothetical protein [Salinicola tamaricis]|uniref:hypothetical protein n=1 Tax=Salinicola tamaricis TaxID=1771309 RepID=UPI0030F41D1E
MMMNSHVGGRQYARRICHSLLLGLLLLCAALATTASAAAVNESQARALLQALDTRSFEAKGEAAQAIADSQASQKTRWLQALLDGRLGKARRGEQFYIVTDDSGREWPLIDAITFAEAGSGSRRTVDIFKINNTLRTQLQGMIASLSLAEGDDSARLAAADRLIGEVNADNVESVRVSREQERVRQFATGSISRWRSTAYSRVTLPHSRP